VFTVFDARSAPHLVETVACHVRFRSDKPLTLGDIIDQTLTSHTWASVQILGLRHGFLGKFSQQDITLAEKIDKMDKQHGCRTVTRSDEGMHIVLALKEKSFHPLVLTAAECVRCRPMENSSL
jgi:hypothetical protein